VAIQRGAADAVAAIAAESAVENPERPFHLGQMYRSLGMVAAGAARDQAVPESADPFLHLSPPRRLGCGPAAAP
jgi:hypothetical protein